MAKTTPLDPESAQVPTPGKSYQVIGLVAAQQQLINFQGREYDLANLSDEELAYLLQFPLEVPYVHVLP